jgi:sulfite dehydrogenase (cytochrome) subunit B
MKLRLLPLLACSAATAMFAADATFTLPPETAKLKPGPGAELVTAQCLLCHSADYISTQPRLTRAQWQAGVTKMQQKYGAPIQTNSVERIVEYLVNNYGNAGAATK